MLGPMGGRRGRMAGGRKAKSPKRRFRAFFLILKQDNSAKFFTVLVCIVLSALAKRRRLDIPARADRRLYHADAWTGEPRCSAAC